MSKSNVNGPEGRETIGGSSNRTTTSWGTATDPTAQWKPNWQSCYPSTVAGELRQETPGWYATVICRNANCRRDWVR